LEKPLKTPTRHLTFLILLGISLLFLPACGSKDNVKSQQLAETVLNPEPTAVSTPASEIGMAADQNDNSPAPYVEKIKRTKDSKIISTTPSVTAVTPAAPPPSTPAPAMETPAPAVKPKSSGWIWWVLILLILGGVGWYFWSESRSGNNPQQPNPPTGGLSPVSGFTAFQNKNEGKSKTKTSFWFKKLF
jgi:hypothetical protein